MQIDKIIKRFVPRFLVQAILMGMAWAFYKGFPFYKTSFFQSWQIALNSLILMWLGISFIYLFTSISFTKKQTIDTGDKFLILISFVKQLIQLKISLNHKKYRNVFFVIFIKIFFIPLMFVFILEHYRVLFPYFADLSKDLFIFFKQPFPYFYTAYFNLLLLLDTIIFFFAYSVESKWLDNRIRDPQPHSSGWIAALICYPPFNGATAQLFTYGKFPEAQWIESSIILTVLQIITLFLYTIYFISTLNLGWNAGNLSRRKIITNGVYGIIRHPAYLTKTFAWWIEHLPYLNFQNALGLIGWSLIYLWRAYTEEIHLQKDIAYVQYMQRVKWRFIPGIF